MNSTNNFFANLKKLSNFKEQSQSIKEDRKDSGISLLSPFKSKQDNESLKGQRKSNESIRSSFFSSWGSNKSATKSIDPDRSPYFIQTWWDPRMPGEEVNENNTSPRSRPLLLVPYLPPIWVEEEMEKVSENNDEITIKISMHDKEDEQTQLQIPEQDPTFLTVPAQNTISSHAILNSNREEICKTRKVRFEIGARLDPNEDCFLNFSHSIHTKCQHNQTKRCHHVRFILEGNEGEIFKNTLPKSPKHKINYKLTSCLKIKTQQESLASNIERPLKSILCTSKSLTNKEVKFDDNISTRIVDRHIEWDQSVIENRLLKQTIRARKLEKRRQYILTKPIEDWIDDVEQDEGLQTDEEDEDNEDEQHDYIKKQDDQFNRLIDAFSDNLVLG